MEKESEFSLDKGKSLFLWLSSDESPETLIIEDAENPPKQAKIAEIMSEIITKLEQAISYKTDTPWNLGWAGSRRSISYKGQTFQVPQGIYEVYKLASENTNGDNYEKIQTIVKEKAESPDPVTNFFRTVVGCRQSEEVQDTYAELNTIVESNHTL